MNTRNFLTAALLFMVMLVTFACKPKESRVFFTNIENGARVSSPIHLEWAAENFKIESAGEVRKDSGHVHILVKVPCIPAGEIIPADASQVHFGSGEMETDIELGPNQVHTLCLQVADGDHRALAGVGMTQEIRIFVIP